MPAMSVICQNKVASCLWAIQSRLREDCSPLCGEIDLLTQAGITNHF